MSFLGHPVPQWTQARSAASVTARLVPVYDAPSDSWLLIEGGTPNGAFVLDPAGSGTLVLDNTVISGLKLTRLPEGSAVIY